MFLKMGGSIERITILPIDVAEDQDAQRMFEHVDVSTSRCHLESDRQMLLGVVEQGNKKFYQKNTTPNNQKEGFKNH